MKVIKFGGTSVCNAEQIKKVESIIKREDSIALIVVSAIAGITNLLELIFENIIQKEFDLAKEISEQIFNIHHQIAKDLDLEDSSLRIIKEKVSHILRIIDAVECLGGVYPETKDSILSVGELLSSSIIHSYLKKSGLNIEYIDPRNILKTNSNFSHAEIDEFASKIAINAIANSVFNASQFAITGGFVGSDLNNICTTIGRGGSDYSATIFAKLIGAKSLEIWTDVDGVLSADPKIISNPILMKAINYEEALEISTSGAKVIHQKTIFPVIDANIPISILNTNKRIGSNGTIISHQTDYNYPIKSITYETGLAYVRVNLKVYVSKFEIDKILYNIGQATNCRVIESSNSKIELVLTDSDKLNFLIKELEKLGEIKVYQNQCFVSLIGENIFNNLELFSYFGVRKNTHIEIKNLLITKSKLRLLIDKEHLFVLIETLHELIFHQSKGIINE